MNVWDRVVVVGVLVVIHEVVASWPERMVLSVVVVAVMGLLSLYSFVVILPFLLLLLLFITFFSM